jgi:MoaA/NifB/PqqE/SkfB family radical SAM enzyme
MMYDIYDGEDVKVLNSPGYNYAFSRTSGQFMRWGKDYDDDPDYSLFGPEIADIEISTICHGIGDSGPCKFCYKSNIGRGKNMSLMTFMKLFHKLPRTLTQIAFGIGDIGANPEMWDIFSYCRENGHNKVIPNVTINGAGLTDEHVEKLSTLCGAVAVSRYNPPGICYDAVKKLTDMGMKQVNIHMLLSRDTYSDCMQVVKDAKEDPRLSKLNAIVFLALKPKGRGKKMKPLADEKLYARLIDKSLRCKINIGFDSCSAPMFLKYVQDTVKNADKALKEESLKWQAHMEQLAEPCESYLFSIYISVDGYTFPCSFLEDTEFKPLDVVAAANFTKDIWLHPSVVKFRETLLRTAKGQKAIVPGCRQCPVYDIY